MSTLDTYYYAQSGATFTGRTTPMDTGTVSDWFRREARYHRALGDEVTAAKWNAQADMEEQYENQKS